MGHILVANNLLVRGDIRTDTPDSKEQELVG